MIKLLLNKKKKKIVRRRRKVSKLFYFRLRFLRSWFRKPLYKSLYTFRRPERYFLRRNTWTHRKILRKFGKKFFYYFLRKVGIYKHMYFLNKYFGNCKRVWDYKLAKKFFKFRRASSTLPSRIKYIKASRFIFRGEQYYDKNNIKKRLSFLNLVKALAYKKVGMLVNDYRRYARNSRNNAVIYSLQKNNVRLFIRRSELSGYRILKYLVLFSKCGNRRRLFNSFISSCLSNRFALFKNLNLTSFFNFDDDNDTNDLMGVKGLSPTKYCLLNLSFFCRRILFNQFFYKKKTFLNKIIVKIFKQFNSSFFLLSNRLINRFLKVFRVFVEIKPWKKSGRAISVPVPIKSRARRSFIFAHWFKESVLTLEGSNFGAKAFAEFQSVSKLEGDSIKKLNHLSKSIQSNRALIRKSNLSIV